MLASYYDVAQPRMGRCCSGIGIYAINFEIDMKNPDQNDSAKILCEMKQDDVCVPSSLERNGRWEGWFKFILRIDDGGFLSILFLALCLIFAFIAILFNSKNRTKFFELYRSVRHPTAEDNP